MRRALCIGGPRSSWILAAGERGEVRSASGIIHLQEMKLPLSSSSSSSSFSTAAAPKMWDTIHFEKRPKEVRQAAATRPKETRRTGAIALKVGMLGVYDQWGQRHPCTVLQLDTVQSMQSKTDDTDGYTAIQLGSGEKKAKRVTLPEKGHLEKFAVPPKRKIWEFRVTPDALIPPGTPIVAQHFVPGQRLDIAGISKGKGFAGVMKRWNFKGQGASHGVSVTHRSLGSTGQNTSPGRVFKGKKMPGRLGGERVTVQNLWLCKIDTEHNLLYVKGHVPGNNGCYVRVTDAVKGANFPAPPPLPTFIPEKDIKYPKEITAPVPENDPLTPPDVVDD